MVRASHGRDFLRFSMERVVTAISFTNVCDAAQTFPVEQSLTSHVALLTTLACVDVRAAEHEGRRSQDVRPWQPFRDG